MKVKLGEICNFEKGTTGIQKTIPGKFSLVVTGPERKSCSSYQFDCEAVCIPLVSSTGHGHKSLNYIHYQSGKFALGTILVALVPKNKNILNAEYLREYLFTLKDVLLVPLMKGGANVTLPIKSILDLEINLPNLKKQQKIIEITRNLRTQINNINKNIETNESQLIKLKSSILVKAIQGKLVYQDYNDEPAKILLERIKAEKDKLIKEGKIREGKTLLPISKDEIPIEMPKGWINERLGKICKFIDYRGKTPQKVDSGIRLITAKNVKFGYLSLNPEEFMKTDDYDNWMTRGIPTKGDILFTTEAPLGNICLYDFDREKIGLAQRIITLHPFADLNSRFLMFAIMSDIIRKQIFDRQTGMTAKGVKSSKLKEIILPIPPVPEQKRIVEKVESLMKICDEQGKNINESKENINKLNQAILSEAFRGESVNNI